jgi:tetratricopeptide (TPR) repeat protein
VIKGTFGFQLSDGDEIETKGDGSAEILWENGNLAQLGPGSRMPIGSSKKPAVAAEQTASLGDQGFQTVQNFIKLKDSDGTSSVGRLRSGDKNPELRAQSPAKTAIQNGNPTFRWSGTEPIADLKLTVYNEEGVFWETEVSGVTSMEYPADAPALVSGVSYSWVVETTDPLQFPPLRSATAFFEVISTEQSKSLNAALAEIDRHKMPSDSAFFLVRASLYYKYGLMSDAIAETRQAVSTDTDNSTLQSILAHLYAQVGLTDEAIQEYDRLLEKR